MTLFESIVTFGFFCIVICILGTIKQLEKVIHILNSIENLLLDRKTKGGL